MTQDMNNDEIAGDPEDKLVHLLKDIDKQIQNGTLSSETLPDSLLETGPSESLTVSQLERLRKSQLALQFINLVRDDLKQRSATQRNPDSTIQEEGTPSDLRDFPGLNELDRFQIIRLIGQGGFAAVFLARDSLLERNVALKIPRPHSLSSPESVKRFQREAKAAALLSHPSIVSVYEAGNVGPIHYLVTDYCQGQSLGQWFKTKQGKINPEVAVRIVQRLAEATQHAHQRGIIHRDLKPENILVVDGEQPVEDRLRIVDFGLAKRTDSEESMVTLDGAVVGTPSFMSPEQARGEKDTTHSADIFSLGVIFYYLLTNQLPFSGGNNLAVLKSVESEDPKAPSVHDPRIPRDLDAICMKCLEKKTVNRYPTAFELAMDLGKYLDGRPISARLLHPIEKLGRLVSRNRLLSGSFFLLFVSLVTGLSLTTWKWMESESHLQSSKAQFDRAEKNIQLAQNTIQDMVGSLAEKLKETPRYSQESLLLAEDALKVQKEILKDRPNHQATIFATAQAHFRVASIARLTSDFIKGVRHSHDAIGLLSKIKGDSESRDRLFLECHFELASCQFHLPESPDNTDSIQTALDSLNPKKNELDPKSKSEFEIRFRYLHARFLVLQRKHVEAIEYCKETLKQFEELSDASSLKAYRGRLHLIAGTAGRILRRYRPRDFHLQRAMTIFNEIHDASPEDHSIWDELADCHSEFGLKFRIQKKYSHAIEHFDKSLQFSRLVQKSFPNRKSHTARVNRALLERSECDLKIGETGRAVDSFWQVSQQYQDLSVERRTDLTAYHLGKLGVQIWNSIRNDDIAEGKKILDCSQSLVEPIAIKNTHPSYNELYADILFRLAVCFEREGEAATATGLADQALDVIVQSKRRFKKSQSRNYRVFFQSWCKFAARTCRKEEIFAKVHLFIRTSEPSANTHVFAAGMLATAAYWYERPIDEGVPISPELQVTYPKDLVSEAIRQMKTAVEVDPKMDYRMFLILNSLYPLRGHKDFEAIIADLKKREKK